MDQPSSNSISNGSSSPERCSDPVNFNFPEAPASSSPSQPVLGDCTSSTISRASTPRSASSSVEEPEVIDLTGYLLSELNLLFPGGHYLDFEDTLMQRGICNVNDLVQLAPGFLTDVVAIPQEAAWLIVNYAQTLICRAAKGKGRAPVVQVKEERED
ncbi:hypothetical protein AAF712_011452 [Marasmius tenuissimus]|uniref:Uncharacterized protein n=1 Tax=Marasmius tenuissimus TaxID=585030 RepID=A0ABR2ZKE2_9AGAR